MEMSLEDIIKKKKTSENGRKKFVPKTKQPLRKTINKPIFKDAKRIADARNKIIQKKRLKIVDARDKLVEINRKTVVDAREKLLLKKGVHNMHDIYGNGHIPLAPMRTKYPMFKQPPAAPAAPRMPEPIRVPRGYVDYDNMERMEEEEYAAATRLSRTVKNDISPYDSYDMPSRSEQPPPPPRRLNSWSSTKEPPFDPFDVYEVPRSRRERRMSTEMLPPSPPKGILRSTSTRQRSPEIFQRRYIPENSSHLSYEMRSRLETAPDPHASMGIFANPLKPTQGHSSSSSSGYRIVVSNLHSSVTQSDIQELFEDIGELYDSRIVRPGVAEVIYKSIGDAEKAVDTYHNRQLDGQPMKCLLVNPRSSNKPTAPAIRSSNSSSSSRLTSGKTPLEIDIDALHKVLFRRN